MKALTATTHNRSPSMWDPFAAVNEMRRHMDELMSGMLGQRGLPGWRPAVDVEEDEQSFTVTMEVPGWAEQDVVVEVDRSLLTIRGQRGGEAPRDGGSGRSDDTRRGAEAAHPADGAANAPRRSGERWSGSFIQSLSLPPSVDSERITARLERGLLTVHLPKQPQAQPRRIAVAGAGREPAGG